MQTMDKILRSFFIFLILSPLTTIGQQKKEIWRYEGPRIGIDLSRFLVSSIHKEIKSAIEFQFDYPYKGNFFPTLELGYQQVNDLKDTYHYLNKGPYGRIGIDLNINMFESLTDNDLVFVGARYGFSRFAHETEMASYTNYWETLQTSFPSTHLNAHWAELVFGLKGELLPNFFFGWSVRAKFLLNSTADQHVKPYVIPGLGYTGTEVPFDFSATISYRLPLIKSKKIPKPLKSPNPRNSDSDSEDDPENQNPNTRNRSNEYGNGSNGLNSQYD